MLFSFLNTRFLYDPIFKKSGVLALLCLVLGGLSACAVNPVTGRNQLMLVSAEAEISIGEEQFGPSQQSQGGRFNTDPGLSAYVAEVGRRLALASNSSLPYEFVVLNNSVPNAWALPGGKIAVNRGLLLELNNEAELAAVLGHEVVHATARHGAQAMSRGMLLQGALSAVTYGSMNNSYRDHIVRVSSLGAELINLSYSREAEREADNYGIGYMLSAGYDPRAAVTLQEVFVRLAEGSQPDWLEGLFSSHPPSRERVENNRQWVNELLASGDYGDLELGEGRYQQQLAFLQAAEPAYALFDEASETFREGDFETALGKVDQAIEAVPEEARFWGLKGDILLDMSQFREAIANYDQAIAKDDAYYEYYLGRGIARKGQGLPELARQDLEKSIDLLPTASAINELGKLALQENQRAAAKDYFALAASTRGAAAEDAREAYLRLDLEDEPEAYLDLLVYVDERGQVTARVGNPTPLILRNIRLEFTVYVDGLLRSDRLNLERLPPGYTSTVISRLRFPAGRVPDAGEVGLRVSAAQVE